MSEAFEKAFKLVIEAEGGFSNDPEDRGGATMWGITQAEIDTKIGHHASIEEVKAFPIEKAKEIYKFKYWDRMRLDEVNNDMLKIMFFDQGVNRGCGTVVKQVEALVSTTADGLMDTITLSKINGTNALDLAFSFFKVSQISYIRIVKNNPSQMVFMLGWINRTHKLLNLIRNNIKLL